MVASEGSVRPLENAQLRGESFERVSEVWTSRGVAVRCILEILKRDSEDLRSSEVEGF